MSTEDDLPCPACGFLSFQGAYGSYDICSICDWEDDGLQLANPCSTGGANHKSLAQVQADALRQYPHEGAGGTRYEAKPSVATAHT